MPIVIHRNKPGGLGWGGVDQTTVECDNGGKRRGQFWEKNSYGG